MLDVITEGAPILLNTSISLYEVLDNMGKIMRNLKKGRSLAKRNNTIQNLRTRLELRQEEMHAISVQLESIELSFEEKNILK